ncbi:MAG: pirin family protein [Myxococcota bacterium]
MSDEIVLDVMRLGFPWETEDPFLFCVHHDDAYPAGNEKLGPAASLAGRDMGQDFAGKDGWRMYHGHVVPGFPQHPHRGFETVTVARRGFIDHSDSLGATARYGRGDVQWLTAGKGIVHAEMFPLLDPKAPNPVELFQIWLNLPKDDKMAEPHFAMLWGPEVPILEVQDAHHKKTRVTIVAGALEGKHPPKPPPRSWASRPDSDVAIWSIKMEPGAEWTIPPAKPGSNRTIYFFKGSELRVGNKQLPPNSGAKLAGAAAAKLIAGPDEVELLMLQGKPIRQPVIQYGPFVMNTKEEIQQAFLDYRATQFGGWPWPSDDPVHPRQEGRFAKRPDGKIERGT